jgi:hypothetical protein
MGSLRVCPDPQTTRPGNRILLLTQKEMKQKQRYFKGPSQTAQPDQELLGAACCRWGWTRDQTELGASPRVGKTGKSPRRDGPRSLGDRISHGSTLPSCFPSSWHTQYHQEAGPGGQNLSLEWAQGCGAQSQKQPSLTLPRLPAPHQTTNTKPLSGRQTIQPFQAQGSWTGIPVLCFSLAPVNESLRLMVLGNSEPAGSRFGLFWSRQNAGSQDHHISLLLMETSAGD